MSNKLKSVFFFLMVAALLLVIYGYYTKGAEFYRWIISIIFLIFFTIRGIEEWKK
jgi:hypothetical protein